MSLNRVCDEHGHEDVDELPVREPRDHAMEGSVVGVAVGGQDGIRGLQGGRLRHQRKLDTKRHRDLHARRAARPRLAI
jgi:hypothetical protein